ncbi:MAG: exodeoxyribonuclease V subunit beta [Candidatus Thiodiazotropha sp.]
MGMDVMKTPLQGINLVEASAGTGKTHTLTTLYLRLLLEQEIAPEGVLVMTYTKAATAELKQRIRNRLSALRHVLQGGESEDDSLTEMAAGQADPERARQLLDLALAGFDQAAIFTIHGFCQRVLSEHAFETGQAFRTELVPDQSVRLQEVVDDFWRREIDRLPALFLQAFRQLIASPDHLLVQLRFALGKPYLQVRSREWPVDLERLEREASRMREEVRALWRQAGDDIKAMLSHSQSLKGNLYRADWVDGWCRKLQAWLQESPYSVPFDKADRFTASQLAASVKKGGEPPRHPFFDCFEAYLSLARDCAEAFDRAWGALLKACYDYLVVEVPRRQMEAGEWSYDDLLLELHKALSGPAGEALASRLRYCYPAALVDEFQDTDPVQYAILRAIYGESERPLFLVGDPKQAIYSFRGADLFAYLRARRELVTAIHELDTNWRSSADLVAGVNSLFASADRPFWYAEIDFHPVTPAPRDMAPLKIRGDNAAPLQVWRLPFDRQTKAESVRQEVADSVADEIAHLLSQAERGQAQLEARPLVGSDFAVLVRTHRQAERIAGSLRARGVNSVRSSQLSVFFTPEAESLERLLLALLEPQRGGRLRAALATPLMGWDANGLETLNRDDQLLGQITGRFFDYHRLWREQGFIVMFRRLLIREGVEQRLLDYRDGERRVTNLLHLAELLYQQESEAGPGMEALVKWLVRQRLSGEADENRLLRLESDSRLVRIDTLHGSKGLEYGIVFCPFLWDEGGARETTGPYLFHDPAMDYAAVLELGSDRFEADRSYQREEALAESLRLLYVALTRARHRCYLPWGLVKNSDRSALAWLLHADDSGQRQELRLAEWESRSKDLDESVVDRDLQALVARSKGCIAVLPMPQPRSRSQLELGMPPALEPARRFTGQLPPLQRVASFSSLVAGHSEDLPDYDAQRAAEAAMQPLPEGHDIHGFPRGAGPGRCLHAILERVDFSALHESELSATVAEQLGQHAIDAGWVPVVARMVQDLVETPLNAQGLKLSQVGRARRVDEMGFHFPVRGLETSAISRLGERHRFSAVPEMTAGLGCVTGGRLQGFVKGFIDLVFEWEGRYYLVDYKSNWLGSGIGDYHQGALRDAMLEHGYPLQYALYTLALHRYLGLRLADYDYERHFGGVYYLFLRGITPHTGSEYGVVAERPAHGFVDALDKLMRQVSHEPA